MSAPFLFWEIERQRHITKIDIDGYLDYILARRIIFDMNVSLTPELEKMVNEKVKSGLYNSASEVIRESLRLLKEQDMLQEIRRNELRREIMLGVEQMRNGQYTTISSKEELEAFKGDLIKEAREKFSKRNAGQLS